MLARLLVDVRAAENGELVDPGRERNRARDLRAGALCGLDDLPGRLVEELVVVGLEPDPNLLSRHRKAFSPSLGAARSRAPDYRGARLRRSPAVLPTG